ncbi:tudor domain-containing protein 15 isoform X2 [Sceloporus undulatus]|nr:tudor domain-containing protein 15 isoform X2 [Sceloporus undulatus]XP_042301945.1 tudor domain-containing protein 15 isoform X2 [Sceloporus undulatus]
MDSSLLTRFLEVHLKLTDIYYHPKEILVKFQGQYYTECEFDYHILQSEIQQVSKVRESLGDGEVCLVEDPDCGEWYRGRIVQKKNQSYEVFLIDSGKVLTVHETHIASATDELFQLPPKMVFGIFANILPVDEKWTLKALNYFSALRNLQIKGQIQAILPHQTFLLDVPKITSDLVDLKLGKLVDGDTFCLIVEMLTKFPKESLCKQMPDLLQQKYTRSDSVLFSAGTEPEQILKNLQPPLPVGKVEKVKISVAVSPSKFYCQLLRQEMDLDMLTAHMSSLYETMSGENILSFENLGVLCAAKRKNGQWHRGVIQQLLSDNKVKVWFMDFGGCEVVPSSYVLKLQPEFISVPGFSFACALSCLNDEEETVRQKQLEIFKEALLRQSTVSVQIDLFCADEYVYYVTLHKYSAENTEHLPQGNNVVPQCCPSFNKEVSCTLGDTTSGASLTLSECNYRDTLQSEHSSDKKDSPSMCCPLKMPCQTAEMKIDSICLAVTVYILNPSNFWVQTKDYLDKFEDLMEKIAGVYDIAETDNILENPEPGKLCCALYGKDKNFYRAVIMKVEGSTATVSFLDFGNTAIVSLFDVRILLPEFLELPALAIYCSLANAHSIQDEWIKKETDFFKTIVEGKLLIIHPIAKKKDVYIVNVQCMNGTEQGDVLKLMIQAGYAEYWEVKKDPLPEVTTDSQEDCSKLECKRAKIKSHTQKNKIVSFNCAGQNKKLLNICPPVKKPGFASIQWESLLSKKYRKAFGETKNQKPYKEYTFKPGTILDVLCCHSISLGHFSCQMQNKLMELNNLMEQIQLHYNTHTNPYENGQVACVVKHSKDGKWYRAAVLERLSRTEVDVLFVDYGNCERVLLKDLQAILPDFLTLESQVFRCCLFKLTESLIFDPCNWTEEAYSDFQDFLSSSHGKLTCTIFALIVKGPNSLYNVVDLRSPFGSLHQFLLERGHAQFGSFEFSRSITPSFSLYSFYYSSFNIKIGNEEKVCVTHIYSAKKFYCQLNRNAKDIDTLLKKIAEISQMTNGIDQIKTNRLCLAQYFEDGLFYRALAFPSESSDYCQVNFVDFGNKQLVAKNKLIPIPDHASELFFTPMQAIKCYLADFKDAEIPVEINKWFETNYLGKDLKAVIVAKESDGQLGVELYDNNLQINRKIRELLKQSKCNKDPEIIDRSREESDRKKEMVSKVKFDADKTEVKKKVVRWNNGIGNKPNLGKLNAECGKGTFDLKKQHVKLPTENTGMLVQSVDHPSQDVLENKMTESHLRKLSPFEQERNGTSRKKYTSLKQHNIQPNTKILGYISWVTSPSSFYIHCAEDEDTIVQLAEKLNAGVLAFKPETHVELEEGDVVLAEYELDYCIYRAVVKEIKSEGYFEIEFIDYGNTTIVSASKIFKMEKDFLNFPRLSIHCFLSKAKCAFPYKDWSSDVAAYFVTKVKDQLLTFEFLQQHGQQWEIDILFNGVSIISELMQREISKGLPKKLVSNLDHITKQLLIADADFCNHYQTKKPESKNMWEGLPKVAYQKIKPGQREIGEIGHVSRNGDFFVKLNKDAQMLLDLNVMAAEEAEKNSFPAVENIKEGLECLTKSQTTLKWYRSEIIRKYADEEYMLVFFMDLGKFEVVSIHDVRTLGGKIRSIPRKAVPCKWVWIGNLGNLSFQNVVTVIKHHVIKFLFLRYLESISVWEVDILIDESLLLEYWNRLIFIRSLTNISGNILMDKTVPELSFRPNSVLWTSFQTDRKYAGFVTSVTDPSDFCIQLEDSFKALKALFMLLSDLPENLPSVPQNFIVPGACCLLKTEDNEKWNRVEVSEVLRVSSMLILTFIDDGLSASFPISDIHKLKVIPEDLVKCPRLTYPSCLFRVSPADGNQWNDEAKLKVQQFFGRQGLTFRFRQNRHGLKLEVDVFCEQKNAADMLVAAGCAVYTKTTASFGSINCANTGLLNSQNLCEPSQMCNQKNSDAIIVLSDREEDPQKTGLHFRCGKISRQNHTKKLCSKKKAWKALICSSRRNNESRLNLFNQAGDRKVKQTHSTGLLSKATHKIPAVSELTAKIDGMQVHEESQAHE